MKHVIRKQRMSILFWHREPRHAVRANRRRWVVGSLSALLATMSATGVAINFPPILASAAPTTLPSSTPLAFEDADGNMTCEGVVAGDCTGTTPNYLDWNSPYVKNSPAFQNVPDTDPGCSGNDIIFASGTKEDSTAVTVACSPSTPKVNLSQAYGWTQTVGGQDYLYLAWEALIQAGSNNNHIDFELNQATPVFSPALNGAGSYTLNRTVGDLLFDFDITPGTPTIAEQTWTGSAWGTPMTLSAAQAAVAGTAFTDPINGASVPVGGFGEMGLNLTSSGLFTPGTCAHLTNLWVKGRSSGSGSTSELKSFIPPTGVNISNCATPGIVTTASATNLPSGSISDSGVLSGGTTSPAIGGTLTFNAYGPFTSAAAANCTSNLAFTKVDTVSSNGTYTAGPHTVTDAGVYAWQVVYSGDGGNSAFTSTCGTTSGGNNELSTVGPASPGIVTTASATDFTSSAAGTISDSGVLSGGSSNIAGTLTFKAYGPFASSGVATCDSGHLAFTQADSVTGNSPPNYTAGPYSVTSAGVYVWQVVYADGNNNSGFTSTCGDQSNGNNEVSTVNPATPGIVTTASATSLPTGSIADSGALSGGNNPTGTLTFKAYGPFTSSPVATCDSGHLAFTKADTVSGNGTYVTGTDPVTNAGVYVWQVTYTGDTNNTGFTSTCGSTSGGNEEVSTVGPATPGIVTTASATDLPSGSISDTGTLSNGSTGISGTLTFNAYGPFASTNGATCDTGHLVYTHTDPVSGNGQYSAGTHPVTSAGVYVWQVVFTDGTNDTGFTSVCGDLSNGNTEVSLVGMANPSIVTTASATNLPSGSISDSGSLSGASSNITGDLVFSAYGPFTSVGAANCTSNLAFSVSDPITGNSPPAYTAGPHTVGNAGVYVWQVVYAGDANNTAFTTTCGSQTGGNNEVSTVNPANPGIVTTASATNLPSGSISDSGTLSGASSNITGNLVFSAYGPFTSVGAANCNVPLAFSVSDPITGNSPPAYTAGPHTVANAGVYVWQVVYAGDANNTAFTTTCGSQTGGNNEVSTVNPANPGIVTTATATALPLGSISDSGTLSGASSNITGNLVFSAYGPFASAGVANCDVGNQVFTTSDPITGNGIYPAGPHTVAHAGVYVWQVVYAGDSNNSGFTTTCGLVDDSNHEVSTVGPASPGIVTTATATDLPSGSIGDSGVLSGGSSNIVGSLVFSAYGPFPSSNGATCDSGHLAFTVTDPVSGNGTYLAGPHTVTAAGVYVWQVTYSDGADNNGFTTTCGDTSNGNSEVSIVGKAHPAVITTASATSLPSGSISDSGTLSGASSNITGSLVFSAYGPFASTGAANCNVGNLVFSVSDPITGNSPPAYTAGPHSVTASGVYVWQVVYAGDSNNAGFTTTCGDITGGNTEVSNVGTATPTIVTHASATDLPSGSISDSGVLSQGSSPTGTLTFNAYGPFASTGVANCDVGNLAFTQSDTVSGNSTYTAGPHTVTAAGVYVWQTVYTGDSNNTGFTSPCADMSGDNNEVSTVGPAHPGIVTTASATGLPGGSISDHGTLSGGSNPTGTLTFNAYGPFASTGAANCTSSLAFTQGDSVSGNGNYNAGPHTVTLAGVYVWQVVYSGDGNNVGFTSACGLVDEVNNEVSTVAPATPGIVTTATATGLPAGTIGDSGNLTGGSNEQGSLTFNAYGPFASAGVANCDSSVAFTVTDSVDGDGIYTAGPHTVTAAGVYVWQVVYTGDANNVGFTSTCGDTTGGNSEVSTVAKASPGIVTTGTATPLPNGTISDSGVFSGGSAPGGSLTFSAFGPFSSASAGNCSGTAVFTTTVTVDGNGPYSAGPSPVTVAGDYLWLVTYTGDANNNGFSTTCGDTTGGNTEVSSVDSPLLTATKTSTPAPGSTVGLGDTVTYGITLTNNGTAPAPAVGVTDDVPAGTTYVANSATCSGGSGCSVKLVGTTVTWSGILVPALTGSTPGTVTVTFQVTVNSSDTNNQTIKNFALFSNENTPSCTTTGVTCQTNTVTLTVIVPATAPGTTTTVPTPIVAATTVHTGEPWSGSTILEIAVTLLGFFLIGLGELVRRRNLRAAHRVRSN